MDPIRSLKIVDGAWQFRAIVWDEILQRTKPPLAELIFTSLNAITSSPPSFQDSIKRQLKLEPALLSRLCQASNGFSGCRPTADENGNLEYYNFWARFVIKQTFNNLRPKRSFNLANNQALDGTNLELTDTTSSRSPIHDQRTAQHGWLWQEIGFFIHWAPLHQSTTILCFDLPKSMETLIESALTSSADKLNFLDPYSVFAVILYPVLSLFDSSVWSMRDHVCGLESRRQLESVDPNYPKLHELARHSIHVSETLTVAAESVNGMRHQHKEFIASGRSDGGLGTHLLAPPSVSSRVTAATEAVGTQHQLEFQLQLLRGLLARSESNKARLQNEINLAFHTTSMRTGHVQVQISAQATREASAMKGIAIVTMTFLPATFISSMFSTPFFQADTATATDGSQTRPFSVSNMFWIYWVLAVPLSLTTVGAWVIWDRRRSRREGGHK